MKVLFLALTATRARAVTRHSHWLLERGVEVTLVTTNPDPWWAQGLDPRVRVLSLREGEGRHPLPRAERVLLFRIPRAVLLRLRRLGGPVGRHASVVSGRYEWLADRVHRKLFLPFYKTVRPYLLWRVANRSVLPAVDLGAVSEVVVADSHAIPLGWHLARRHPQLKIGFSLDRSAYTDESDEVTAAEV